MALVQNPILKYWAEDSANVKSLTQSDIGAGIVLQSDIYSNEVNAATQSVWQAVQYLQHTGGLYNAVIPYTNPDVVSIITYNGGIYGIGQYVRLTTNPGSTTNNPPITGATISTVNGVDVYAGGVSNSDWYLTSSPVYDLIIDSDAKLALWANVAATGTYTKVLIKAGTWNFDASTNTKVSGQGVNLADAGTKEIIGESGSILNFTNITTGVAALYYTSVPTTNDYRISNVSISIAGSNGFGYCLNLSNCYANCSSAGYVSFYESNNIFNCNGVGVGYSSGVPGVFYHCNNLFNCNASATTGARSAGFASCDNLFNCVANITASTVSVGFHICINLQSCTATCSGTTNYGFDQSKRMLLNKSTATTKYQDCYVDNGTTYGITSTGEDTPDGGWNL